MKLNNNVKQTTELEIGQLWKVGDFHIEIVNKAELVGNKKKKTARK